MFGRKKTDAERSDDPARARRAARHRRQIPEATRAERAWEQQDRKRFQ